MDVLSIIGWGGSALVVVSLLQTRILRLRLLNLIGCVVLVFFNLAIEVWPMVGMNAVLAVINVVHLWRLLRHRHDEAEYTVFEVNPDDAYLGYVLTSHRRTSAGSTPSSRRRTARTRSWCSAASATVGVVLAHDAGDGRAQIDLDYVLPKYRDFTPGEFVFRRSDVFTDHGFRQVMAPRRMQDSASYLSKVGFHPDGPDLVLDLA